jgi:hypothetical protein
MPTDATLVLIQQDAAQESFLSSAFRAGPFGVRRLRIHAPLLRQLAELAPGLRGTTVIVADLARLAAEGLWWPDFCRTVRTALPAVALLATDGANLLPRHALRQWAKRHGAHDLIGALSPLRVTSALDPLQTMLAQAGLPALPAERVVDMLRTVPSPANPVLESAHRTWRSLEQSGVDVRVLVRQMRASGGVEVRDRLYRFKTYPQCFRGDEATQWLASHLGISRAQAVDVGELLRLQGALAHVVQDHGFLDEGKFYRFIDDAPDVDAVDLDLVAHECRMGGFDVRDRIWHGRAYPKVFIGAEAHGWLMRFYGLRSESAQQLGQRLLETHLFRHVVDEHPFSPKDLFYRFTTDRPAAHPALVPSAIPAYSRSAP